MHGTEVLDKKAEMWLSSPFPVQTVLHGTQHCPLSSGTERVREEENKGDQCEPELSGHVVAILYADCIDKNKDGQTTVPSGGNSRPFSF